MPGPPERTAPMAKVFVQHEGYGCDTGCCGHVIHVGDEEHFRFEHPYGVPPEGFHAWAERLVAQEVGAEHVADLDWSLCVVLDD